MNATKLNQVYLRNTEKAIEQKNALEKQKIILAELFALSMTLPVNKIDLFVEVWGHVKVVHIRVNLNTTFIKCQPYNEVFNVFISQKSKTFTQELQKAHCDVLEIIQQQTHLVASVTPAEVAPLRD